MHTNLKLTNLPAQAGVHKFKVALFIGRFQPFHNGHLYSLEKCLEIAKSVIIGIGSSQESETENNPWSYEERRQMVEVVLAANHLEKRIMKVLPIPDFPGDTEWAEYVLTEIEKMHVKKEVVVCVSNNEWTNNVLKNVGMNVYESGLYNREELEGVKIRKLMRKDDPPQASHAGGQVRKGDMNWEKRVPKCVIPMCTNYFEK